MSIVWYARNLALIQRISERMMDGHFRLSVVRKQCKNQRQSKNLLLPMQRTNLIGSQLLNLFTVAHACSLSSDFFKKATLDWGTKHEPQQDI